MLRNYIATHPRTRWTGIVLGSLMLLIVLFLSLFDWNLLKPTLARMITEKTGRPTRIDGALEVHLWSWSPSAEVDGLTLDNPGWAHRKAMFHADRLEVSVSLGWLLRGKLVLPSLELVKPSVDLERTADGRASWELGTRSGKPQAGSTPAKLPAIRRLTIEDGTMRVDDQVRKLILDGALNAADQAGRTGAGFTLTCGGSLNQKPFHAQIHGGPLINLDPDHPYDVDAHVVASDITLDAHAVFPKPFDMAAYRVKFTISGRDLADVYYLTGLTLPNTPPYQLSADVRHTGTVFRMDDLVGKLGSSDLEGEVEVDSAARKPKLSARLHSDKLAMVDVEPTLGHPATDPSTSLANSAPPAASGAAAKAASPRHRSSKKPPAAPPPPPATRLFPDADLQVDRVRAMNADVTYSAKSVLAPKLPMKEVAFHLQLEDGLLRLDPLSFVLDAGTFSGSVVIDARPDVPAVTIDMGAQNVDLGQFKSANATRPPLAGTVVGRLHVEGTGSSVHKLAAGADGYLSVALPHGDMNKAIAELTGINVIKGLGLLLTDKQEATQIRCGIIDFQAQRGMLAAKPVFIDTSSVLITGKGGINLKDEKLDLTLQGHPKKVTFLRLHAPITLQGTLLHPDIGIKGQDLALQAGIAVALGTLLTPAAAALALIDPGLAKNKDCSTVLAEAQGDATDTRSAPTPAGRSPSDRAGGLE